MKGPQALQQQISTAELSDQKSNRSLRAAGAALLDKARAAFEAEEWDEGHEARAPPAPTRELFSLSPPETPQEGWARSWGVSFSLLLAPVTFRPPATDPARRGAAGGGRGAGLVGAGARRQADAGGARADATRGRARAAEPRSARSRRIRPRGRRTRRMGSGAFPPPPPGRLRTSHEVEEERLWALI